MGSSVVLDSVCKAFDSLEVLRDVTFSVEAGEFVALVGPSGCGKTTLLRLMAGLVSPENGEVRVGGSIVNTSIGPEVGFVFQEPVLLPWKTVIENVRLPELILPRGSAEFRDAYGLLSLVGLKEFADSSPDELSGGMRKRVELVRALVNSPTLLLLDEPFRGLDEFTREELQYELLRLCAEFAPTVVFVTHSLEEATLLADRVFVLSNLPCTVAHEGTVNLPRPRTPEHRVADEFYRSVAWLRNASGLSSHD